ncbi:MAG: hypothetical protein DRR42_19675, partial [Gammaproteobacteria bacterium]
GSVASVVAPVATDTASRNASKADVSGLSVLDAAAVLAEVNAALDTVVAELGVGAPANTASIRTMLATIYPMLINKMVANKATNRLEAHNAAGTKTWSKVLNDDGAIYTEDKAT